MRKRKLIKTEEHNIEFLGKKEKAISKIYAVKNKPYILGETYKNGELQGTFTIDYNETYKELIEKSTNEWEEY